MSDPLLCVIGMPRSGTIWTTRLIGQAVDSPTDTREGGFKYERDPAVWGADRPGGLIRRLHIVEGPKAYPYTSPVVLVARHPGDIAVSQSYFYNKEVNSHFRHVLSKWLTYYRDWLRDKRVVAVTRYEDIHRNPQVELGMILAALIDAELPLHRIPTSKEIAHTVRDNSFHRMKNWAKRKGSVRDWVLELDRNSKSLWAKTQQEYEIVRELGYT